MTQHVTAIYENGVLKPFAPLDLREQELVSLSVDKIADQSCEPGKHESDETLFDVLDEAGLVGIVKDAPPDLSTNPKHMEGFGKSGQ